MAIRILLFTALVNLVYSQCPIMEESYQLGFQENIIIGQADIDLIRNGALIGDNDIGTVFFLQDSCPLDAYNDFNNTLTLTLAQQIFLEKQGRWRTQNETLLLQQNANCLPLSKRCSSIPTKSCPKDMRFRTITGEHNNLKNTNWGKAITPYGRLQPSNFSDGVYEIRKSVVKQKCLPKPRTLSNEALNKNPYLLAPSRVPNHGGVMYGQFMAHDHGMRQMYQFDKGGLVRTCCNKDYTKKLSEQPYGCIAIDIPANDPFLPKTDIRCMNYIRSQRTFSTDCKRGEPVNLVTHYLDLSTVYGSKDGVISQLRSFEKGSLKTNENNFFPKTCTTPNEECYLTGDLRGTGFFVLAVIQSMYHRLHNEIAKKLAAINPHWNDERLFQEARRINIAIYQNIVYTEWLPLFVGVKETKEFQPKKNNYCGRYDATIDASSTIEFSNGAFRLYHSNLADTFDFLDANYSVINSCTIDECDSGIAILESQFDNVARGLLLKPASLSSYSYKVRSELFNNNNKLNLGLDLLSHDILGGRDNGLQPYYSYYQLCTGKEITAWDDLRNTISAASVEDLKRLYSSVFDVDAFVGMALEIRNGTLLGTVGKCIMTKQYQRTRSGDRYFYSLQNGAYPFSKDQLKVIYNVKYANVICITTNIDKTPAKAFEIPSKLNRIIPCKGKLDLSAWKENRCH